VPEQKKKPWNTGAGSGHITNLERSILETFDIYELIRKARENKQTQALLLKI